MDTNDYIGSFAQENVQFQTQVVRTARVGDNFMKTCIFVTNKNLTSAGVAALVDVPGSTMKALTVTSEDFASNTTGLLQSWLTDLYANGSLYDTILMVVNDGETLPDNDALTAAYDVIKPYAYHKTICIGDTLEHVAPETDLEVSPTLSAKLSDLCLVDKEVLSSAVLLPYSTQTPATLASDLLYNACKAKFPFMACHADTTRNAALYSLGLALAQINGSGSPIGNPMCRPSSGSITPSGADGTDLGKPIRATLNAANIQTFKYVGDNTGNVCAEGEKCLNGDFYAADWIIAYIGYMTKVDVARLVTGSRTFYKTNESYGQILEVLRTYLKKFGGSGSGRLTQVEITAPAFGTIESENDELIIPNAWQATFIGVVNTVTITGTLYIEA